MGLKVDLFFKKCNFEPNLLLKEAPHNFSHRDMNHKGCNAPSFYIGIKFLGVLVEEYMGLKVDLFFKICNFNCNLLPTRVG